MKVWKQKYTKRARFLLKVLKPEHLTNICDVGANPISEPAYKKLHDLEGCHIWGFEPGKEAFAKLEDMQGERATYFNLAVGAKGKATFYAHPIGSIASTFKIHGPSARFLGKGFWVRPNIEKIPMELHTLDSIKDLPGIDVLKMDLQGGELSVLKTGRKKLAEAVCVIPEVRFYRMYEGEPLWADVDQELHKQGFVLHKLMFAKSVTLPSSQAKRFGKRRAANQLLDGDAVYIRNLEDPDKVSTEQLKHLAIAADTIFQSFDLVAMCLDLLVARDAVPKGTPRKYVNLLPPFLLEENDQLKAAE